MGRKAGLSPGGLRPLASGHVHVWYALLQDLRPRIESLAGQLSPAEQLRAARFIREKDQVDFTLSHGFLRSVLGRYHGAGESSPARPEPGGANLGVSLARSGEAAICAVGCGNPVGIDLERVERLPDLEALAASVLSPREREAFAALPAALRDRAFCLLWVSKEAVLKLDGRGLGVPPRDLEVGPLCWHGTRFTVDWEGRAVFVRTFGIADHGVAALATPREPDAVQFGRVHPGEAELAFRIEAHGRW